MELRVSPVGRTAGGIRLVVPLLFLACLAPGPTAQAQGVRGQIQVTGSYLDYPVLVRDSIPETEVPGDGITRRLPDGTVVTCIPGGDCYWYRSGPKKSAHPLTQDLRMTAWPGWRGVSSRLHLRGRLLGDEFWPGDANDVRVLNAYVDLDRAAWRFRGGRQEKTGGLGFHFFDGIDVLWKGSDILRLEGYAGRSLVRTAFESHTGPLLQDSEDLAPDKPATLFGMEGRVRAGLDFSGSLLYQRELRTDRAGLYSERMALDLLWAHPMATVDVSADFDVASTAFNEARIRLKRPLRRDLVMAAEARYYQPYFDLWTIWGAFSPVGFTQGKLDVSLTPAPGRSLSVAAAWRDYEDTRTGAAVAPIEGDGWFSRIAGEYALGGLGIDAVASVHKGYGAYRGMLDFRAMRRWDSGERIGVFLSGTQQIAEFRFGEGVTRGAGIEGRISRGPGNVEGRIGVYRHTFENRPAFNDYTQLRAWLSLTVGFGEEPESFPGTLSPERASSRGVTP